MVCWRLNARALASCVQGPGFHAQHHTWIYTPTECSWESQVRRPVLFTFQHAMWLLCPPGEARWSTAPTVPIIGWVPYYPTLASPYLAHAHPTEPNLTTHLSIYKAFRAYQLRYAFGLVPRTSLTSNPQTLTWAG